MTATVIPIEKMVREAIESAVSKVMHPEPLKVKLDENATAPVRAHQDDAGLDIMSAESVAVPSHDSMVVETGVHVQIPKGYVGLLTSKSGLMAKNGVTTRGTIDSGYTGSIKVVVFNDGGYPLFIKRGQKITQLLVIPIATPEVEIVDSLDETDRGENGFGSTGA